MTDSSRPVWPRRVPIFRLTGMAVSLLLGILFVRAWLVWSASPLERFYLPTYSRLSLFSRFSLPILGHKSTGFRVVFVGRFLATDASLENGTAAISIREITTSPYSFRTWLQANIYGEKSLARALEAPLIGFGICFVSLMFAGARLDWKSDARAREGRLLRGPSLTSRSRFNRLIKGDGLRFRLTSRRNIFEWLKPGDSGKDLVIKGDREAHHIQIAGDTGSGKSTLVRQIVYQIAARNEMAIIFDPDREYIREFFCEDRGDWVLNPKDDRCPYWPIGEECDDEAEATPIAIGLFPDESTRQQFFLSHTRAIFSYLLATYKPTVNELAYWMAHPEEIDKRVVGTEHQHTLTVNAAPQRAGILGSLNEAGKPLRMMPTHAEGRRSWSVREWSKNRKGWIFITSTPDTIDALRPLQSLWLDMLILKLQTSVPLPAQTRVWMVLDELASLNALPQLHSALTKQRKSDNPIVLGFQGMSQLDAIYGKKAETILSQAYTNIVLRTREPRTAKHLSELIGKAQIERMRESKPSRLFERKHGSFSTERVIDPVVLESQIQGLEDLTGYFVQRDKIVPIRFRPQPKRNIAPDLIERVIPPVQHRPLDPEPVQPTPKPEQLSIGVDMLG
ncbi:MAG: type IV secretion system DNA-binding domain-containing protein [Bryobacteraceae bacterium]